MCQCKNLGRAICERVQIVKNQQSDCQKLLMVVVDLNERRVPIEIILALSGDLFFVRVDSEIARPSRVALR